MIKRDLESVKDKSIYITYLSFYDRDSNNHFEVDLTEMSDYRRNYIKNMILKYLNKG
jgi:hypothetical protein